MPGYLAKHHNPVSGIPLVSPLTSKAQTQVGLDMANQIEMAKKRLFSPPTQSLSNLKVFLGSSRDSTKEQIAEQINRVVSQIEAGEFTVITPASDED